MGNLNQATTNITSIKNDITTCHTTLKNTLNGLGVSTGSYKMLDLIKQINKINGINQLQKIPKWCTNFNLSNTWLSATPAALPAARACHGSAVVGNKIYVMGGLTSSAHNTNYCFDITTNKWSTLTALPEARARHTAVAVGTKIYVMGGWSGSNYSKTNYCYDTKTNTWTELATLPATRAFHTAVVAGNNIYIMGGENVSSSEYNTNYCYIV